MAETAQSDGGGDHREGSHAGQTGCRAPVEKKPKKAIDLARSYTKRGWAVVPIPHGQKGPRIKGWQDLRLTETNLPEYFDEDEPSNIGVLLGEPSNWLIDVDLDHPAAVELADDYLPTTAAIFGRKSNPASHRLYRVTGPMNTKKFQTAEKKMLLEVRSTGCQTVMPGSVHPSGERVRWEPRDDGRDGNGRPKIAIPTIEPEALLEAAGKLAEAAAEQIGEPLKQARAPHISPKVSGPTDATAGESRAMRRARAYVQKMDPAINGQGGHNQTFAVACVIYKFGLDDDEAWTIIEQYNRRCQPPWSDDDLRHKLDHARARVEQEGELGVMLGDDAGKRIVELTPVEHAVVDEVIEGLAEQDHQLYQRAAQLVRVIRVTDAEPANDEGIERPAGTPVIRPVSRAHLRDRITRVVWLEKYNARVKARVSAHPPDWLSPQVAERAEYPGIRVLTGISDAPVLRADGSVHQAPGHDARTGMLYEPSAQFPAIPNAPDRDDAAQARKRLLDPVCDFPFAEEAHGSAWLAAVLTPVARTAFSGPAPGFLTDANIRGSGKSILMSAAGRIATGQELPRMGYVHDEQETRKAITAAAIVGDRVVLLDNIDGAFGNAALDRALTGTFWKDRILGGNQMYEGPLKTIWFATGNNVQIEADATRRWLHIRLHILEEHPEHRSDFKYPDFLSHIARHRPQLYIDALTMLVAYIRAGKPDQKLRPFGSFEGWSALVRSAIVWAGMPDPCESQQTLEAVDTTVDALAQLLPALQAWQQRDTPVAAPVSASTIIQKLYPERRDSWPADEESRALRAAIEALTGASTARPPSTQQLGIALGRAKGRVVGGRYLDHGPARKGATKQWIVRQAK